MKAGATSVSAESVRSVQDFVIDVPLGVEGVWGGKLLPTVATSILSCLHGSNVGINASRHLTCIDAHQLVQHHGIPSVEWHRCPPAVAASVHNIS